MNDELEISMTKRNEIIDVRLRWYSFMPVLFEIAKTQHKRELAFINKIDKDYPFRYRFAFIVDRLKQIFDRLDFLRKPYNMYQSVAVLNDMPIVTFSTLSIKELKETPEYKDFDENFRKKMFGYDLFFDIDGKINPQQAYQDAKKLKKILDDNKIPYYILNSSDSGFHIRVPFEYLEGFNLDDLSGSVHNIKGIFRLSCLDDSVGDYKRLCKTPYSIDCKSMCVCLPLSDFDFDNWSPDRVKVDYLMKNVMLKGRGVLIRKHNLSDLSLKENVKRFINKYRA